MALLYTKLTLSILTLVRVYILHIVYVATLDPL